MRIGALKRGSLSRPPETGILIPSVPARNAGPDLLKSKNNSKSG
jgi:hypothetical protein